MAAEQLTQETLDSQPPVAATDPGTTPTPCTNCKKSPSGRDRLMDLAALVIVIGLAIIVGQHVIKGFKDA